MGLTTNTLFFINLNLVMLCTNTIAKTCTLVLRFQQLFNKKNDDLTNSVMLIWYYCTNVGITHTSSSFFLNHMFFPEMWWRRATSCFNYCKRVCLWKCVIWTTVFDSIVEDVNCTVKINVLTNNELFYKLAENMWSFYSIDW